MPIPNHWLRPTYKYCFYTSIPQLLSQQQLGLSYSIGHYPHHRISGILCISSISPLQPPSPTMPNKSLQLQYQPAPHREFHNNILELEIGGCSVESLHTGTKLRTFCLIMQHFVLNPYNKMRVSLTVQITSQIMIETCKEFCTPPMLDNIDRYIDWYHE
jgi:hypothetical protein